MSKKDQETIETLNESQNKYKERIEYYEREFVEQTEERIRKVNEEKDQIQSKLDTYKKEQKEKELQKSRQISHLEKDKAVVEEKLTNLEVKKNELQSRLTQDNERLSSSI